MRVTVLFASALVMLVVCAFTLRVHAQEPHEHHHDMSSPSPAWTWSTDGNLFFGYNYQHRAFGLNESSWESQNWFMLDGQRRLGRGELSLDAMLSLEPFTLHPEGSPQLFQTGEVYQHRPIINFQHPHDLFMGLGGAYRVAAGRVTYTFGADLVGSPTLGPTAFMHRESARDNPQVPLIHHYLDSTHSTPGVLRAGVTFGSVTFESSVFRGAEPDEQRTTLERPGLDSWAIRARFDRGAWHAQVSGGHLAQPEAYEPFDQSRITASVSYDGSLVDRPLSVTVAWGGIREFNGFNGDTDALLFEGDYRATRSSTFYGRLEVANKEVLGLEFHTRELAHPHFFYLLNVGTVGYIRELPWTRAGRMGVGADITLYRMPPELAQFYAGASSYHVFLRWRPNRAVTQHHH